MQVIDLFGQFINHKLKRSLPRSLRVSGYPETLTRVFEDKPASAITRNDAEKFSEWLSTRLHLLPSQRTANPAE